MKYKDITLMDIISNIRNEIVIHNITSNKALKLYSETTKIKFIIKL